MFVSNQNKSGERSRAAFGRKVLMEQQQQPKKPTRSDPKLKLDSLRSSGSEETNKLLWAPALRWPLPRPPPPLLRRPNELWRYLRGHLDQERTMKLLTPALVLGPSHGRAGAKQSPRARTSWSRSRSYWSSSTSTSGQVSQTEEQASELPSREEMITLRARRRTRTRSGSNFKRVMTNNSECLPPLPGDDNTTTRSLSLSCISLEDRGQRAAGELECGYGKDEAKEQREQEEKSEQDENSYRAPTASTNLQRFALRNKHIDTIPNTSHHRHRHKHAAARGEQRQCRYNYSQSFRLNNVMEIIIMIAILVINSVAHFNCLQLEQHPQQLQLQQEANFLEGSTNRHQMGADIWPGLEDGPRTSRSVPVVGQSWQTTTAEREAASAAIPHSPLETSTEPTGLQQGDESFKEREEVLMKLDKVGVGVNKIKEAQPAGPPKVSARDDNGELWAGSTGASKTGEQDKRRPGHANVAGADVALAKHEHDDMMAVPDDNYDAQDNLVSANNDYQEYESPKDAPSDRDSDHASPICDRQAEAHRESNGAGDETLAELDDYNDYGTYIIYEQARKANGTDDDDDDDDHEQTFELWPGTSTSGGEEITSHQSLQRIFYAARSGGQHLQSTSSHLNDKRKQRNDFDLGWPAGDRQEGEHDLGMINTSVPVAGKVGGGGRAKSDDGDQFDINHQVQEPGTRTGERSKGTAASSSLSPSPSSSLVGSTTITPDPQTGSYLTFKFATEPSSLVIVGSGDSFGGGGGAQLLSATYQAASTGAGGAQNASWPWPGSERSSSVSASRSALQEALGGLQQTRAESAEPSEGEPMAAAAATRLRRHRDHRSQQDVKAEMSTHLAFGDGAGGAGKSMEPAAATVTQRQQPSRVNTSTNNGRPAWRAARIAGKSFHVDAPTTPQPMLKVRRLRQEEGEASSLSSSSPWSDSGVSVAELDEEDVKWLNKMNEKSFGSGREQAPSAEVAPSSSWPSLLWSWLWWSPEPLKPVGSSDIGRRDHHKEPLSENKQTPAPSTSGEKGPGKRDEGDLFVVGRAGPPNRREGPMPSEWMNNRPASSLLHKIGSSDGRAQANDNQQSGWPSASSSGANPAASHLQLHRREEAPNHDHNNNDDDDDGRDHLNITTTISSSDQESSDPEHHNIYYWRLIWFVLPLGATFGNLLVIMAVHQERSLQSVTNYFIVSLAFADLFVGLIVMPFAVYVLVNEIWELGDSICDIFVAVDVTSSTASILNLVAISIDRYLAIAHPIAYSAGSSRTRAMLTICAVWLISCAVGAPIILGLNTSAERKSTHCMLYNSTFIFWSSLTSFYVPCIIMIGLYWRIFSAIRSRTKKAIQAGQPALSSSKAVSLTNNGPNNTAKNNNNILLANSTSPTASNKQHQLAAVPNSRGFATGGADANRTNGGLALISPVDAPTNNNKDQIKQMITKTTTSMETGAEELVLSAQFGQVNKSKPLQAPNSIATTTTTTSTTTTATNQLEQSTNSSSSTAGLAPPAAKSKPSRSKLSQSLVQQSLVVAAATSGQLQINQRGAKGDSGVGGGEPDDSQQRANHRGLSLDLNKSSPLKLIAAGARQSRSNSASSTNSSASGSSLSSSRPTSQASSGLSLRASSRSSVCSHGLPNAIGRCNQQSNVSISNSSESTSINNRASCKRGRHRTSQSNASNHLHDKRTSQRGKSPPLGCANLARLLREEQRQSAAPCLGVPTDAVLFQQPACKFRGHKLTDLEKANHHQQEYCDGHLGATSAGSLSLPSSPGSLSSSSSISGDENDEHRHQRQHHNHHIPSKRRSVPDEDSAGAPRRSTAGELQLRPELSSGDLRRYSTSTSWCHQHQQLSLASPGTITNTNTNDCGCPACGEHYYSKSLLSVEGAGEHRPCCPESTCSFAESMPSHNDRPAPTATCHQPEFSSSNTTSKQPSPRHDDSKGAQSAGGVVRMAREELKRRSIKLGALITGRTSKTSQQVPSGEISGKEQQDHSRDGLRPAALVSDSSVEPTLGSSSGGGKNGTSALQSTTTFGAEQSAAAKSIEAPASPQTGGASQADKQANLLAKNINTSAHIGQTKPALPGTVAPATTTTTIITSTNFKKQTVAICGVQEPQATNQPGKKVAKGQQAAPPPPPGVRHNRAGSRRRRERNAAKRERKATKTLAIVLGIFLICWTPFFTCNIIDGICIQLNMDCRPGMMAYLVVSWLGYINSCVNPIIYTIFNVEFRRAFKKILTTKPKCCLD